MRGARSAGAHCCSARSQQRLTALCRAPAVERLAAALAVCRAQHPAASSSWTRLLSSRPSVMAEASTSGAAASAEDPIVQYVVLRSDLWKDLKWPLGSVAAQVRAVDCAPHTQCSLCAAQAGRRPAATTALCCGACVCSCAQACHASTAVQWLHRDDQHTQAYLADLDNMRKVKMGGDASARQPGGAVTGDPKSCGDSPPLIVGTCANLAGGARLNHQWVSARVVLPPPSSCRRWCWKSRTSRRSARSPRSSQAQASAGPLWCLVPCA